MLPTSQPQLTASQQRFRCRPSIRRVRHFPRETGRWPGREQQAVVRSATDPVHRPEGAAPRLSLASSRSGLYTVAILAACGSPTVG